MLTTVNEKGKRILQIMAEHGYATYKEFQVVTGTKRNAFRFIDNAMRILSFIESFDTGLIPSKAYYLTKKGAELLSTCGSFRVMSLFKPCDFGPTEFYHTLAIIHSRLAIEKHPQFLDFETPRVLLTRIGELPELKPDAEIVFRENLSPETGTFRAGLEVELRPKWHKRNIKKMKKFDTGKFAHLQSIIWVCGDNVTVDALCRAIEESKVVAPEKHRFLLLDELLEQGILACRIIDWKGKECGLL